ncbi:MAG: GNAT family N-acetyltransferase [Chloroflexi bacterium]|nr:MAG: GNAT family N-acetyltransferase [Chloroflexota bacterium]
MIAFVLVIEFLHQAEPESDYSLLCDGFDMQIHLEGPINDPKSADVCETILRALPDWFGMEEAILHYIKVTPERPTLISWDGESPVGFLSILQHNPYSAEIYVMGVLPAYHRCGIGRALVQAAEVFLREAGIEYLQVKTLAPTHPDPHYARTRAFYQAIGFRPLEIFPTLWNEENPCLVLVKKL